MPKRAGLYLRISEDRSGEGLGVDRQREDCQQLITSRGWALTDSYTDNDITASGRKRRPQFERLLADVQNERIDVIVAWALDRLVRSPRDRLHLVEVCREKQVSVAIVRGSDIDLTTAAGRLYAGVLGEVAQHELDSKSERQRRQVRQAMEQGLPTGGPRAFGYRAGGYEIEPLEEHAVREMYSRFLAGAGLGELCDWLNREGWRTPKGFKWRSGSVRQVLANPRNCGLRGIRRIVNEQTGRRTQYHEIVGPAVWPPIVDETTWRAAMAILQDPARRVTRNHNMRGNIPTKLLSKIATCGRCGLHMVASTTSGNRRSYRCSSKMHFVRDAVTMEAYVQRVLLNRLGQPDAVGLLLPPPPDVDVAALRGESVALRSRLDGLARDYADGVLDRDQVRSAGEQIRSRLAMIDSEMARAGKLDVVAPLVLAQDEVARWEVWESYSMPAKRAVIERVMRITVFRGRVGRPPAGVGFDPKSVRIDWVDAS